LILGLRSETRTPNDLRIAGYTPQIPAKMGHKLAIRKMAVEDKNLQNCPKDDRTILYRTLSGRLLYFRRVPMLAQPVAIQLSCFYDDIKREYNFDSRPKSFLKRLQQIYNISKANIDGTIIDQLGSGSDILIIVIYQRRISTRLLGCFLLRKITGHLEINPSDHFRPLD